MTKSKKKGTRRRKKSEAWKNLKKVARKGPKRVRLHRQRFKKGFDPLTDAQYRRVVQVVSPNSTHFAVIMLRASFSEMNMTLKKSYHMPQNTTERIGRIFAKIIEAFSHNDIVLKRQKEFKFKRPMSRCVALVGTVENPDATIHITKKEYTKEE